ncbi:MAG: hypothetical protein JWO82_1042, partial [Akkermansiaceae bacterium]|nr:hypothetical protein [Akkermansiaceae bacterium]
MISQKSKRHGLEGTRVYMRGTAAALAMTALGLSQGYAQELAHRWSFTNLTDSVGGGTATLVGTASINAGALVLPGGAARTNCATIPIGPTLASTNSLTVETWFTTATAADWAKVWMFGTPGASSGTSGYLDFTPRAGITDNPPTMSFKLANGGEVNTRAGTNPAALANNVPILSTVVYDDANDQIRLYLNGVLADSEVWTGTISQLGNTTQNYIGAPVFYGDPCFTGSVDELRIWKGAMSDSQVLANFTAGPNAIAPHDPQLQTSNNANVTSSGSVTVINLPIQNKGTANSLSVTGATITGDDAALFSLTSTLPLNIAPGATSNLVLSFNPANLPGTYHATVTTTSNDSFKTQEIINITAQVAIPDIDVPSTASYGPVANTAPIQTYNIQINNTGLGQLEVYNAEFVADINAPTIFQQFKVTRDFDTQGSLFLNANTNVQLPFTFDGVGLEPGVKT